MVEIALRFWHKHSSVSVRTITISAESHVGQLREDNEDFFGVHEPVDEEDLRARGRLAVVCDGMGGGVCGLTASRLAVKIMIREYRDAPPEVSVEEALRRGLESANTEVFKAGIDNVRYRGMGTTATAIAVLEDEAYLAHVGDSRAYLVRDESISQITDDHTLVNKLLRSGAITEEQARDHPQSHVITRCIGGRPRVEVDIIGPLALQTGDRFVLCSDGLYGQVNDDAILYAVCTHPPREACQSLVEQANDSGGADNITVLILSVEEEESD